MCNCVEVPTSIPGKGTIFGYTPRETTTLPVKDEASKNQIISKILRIAKLYNNLLSDAR